jgi:excisionase family DNA binding protein
MTAPVTWSPSAQAALDRLEGKLFATTTECAVVLRCDARTLRKAIGSGDVPAIKAGSTYRIPVSWITEQARLGSGDAA